MEQLNIPEAPDLLTAKQLVAQGMKECPVQAQQILTSLGVIKNAKKDSYESYCALCDELSVKPVSEEQWAEKDKSVFKPLIVASLAKNLPGVNLTDADLEAMLAAADGGSKREATGKIIEVVLKVLCAAPDETVKQWAGLAKAAATLI